MASSASSVLASAGVKGGKICVLGAGSYGTAIANVATFNGSSVSLYMRSAEQAAAINSTHVNPKRFTDCTLPDAIVATSDFDEAVAGAEVIVLAIPSQVMPDFISKFAGQFPAGVPVVSTAKGIHVATHQLMSEAIPTAFGDRLSEVSGSGGGVGVGVGMGENGRHGGGSQQG